MCIQVNNSFKKSPIRFLGTAFRLVVDGGCLSTHRPEQLLISNRSRSGTLVLVLGCNSRRGLDLMIILITDERACTIRNKVNDRSQCSFECAKPPSTLVAIRLVVP